MFCCTPRSAALCKRNTHFILNGQSGRLPHWRVAAVKGDNKQQYRLLFSRPSGSAQKEFGFHHASRERPFGSTLRLWSP